MLRPSALLLLIAALPLAGRPATVELRTAESCGPWPQVKDWTPFPLRRSSKLPGYGQRTRPPLDRFGGRSDRQLPATGFFRVAQDRGRWWLVTPEGHPCLSPGVANVGQGEIGTPAGEAAVRGKFGDVATWADATIRQLRTLGLTSISSDGKSLPEALCHAALLQGGERMPRTVTWQLLADFGRKHGLRDPAAKPADTDPKTFVPACLPVFHPAFAQFCDDYARERAAPLKEDLWLIGYFTDNELPCFPRALDQVLQAGPEDPRLGSSHPAAVAWLRARHGRLPAPEQLTEEDRTGFLGHVFDRYYALTTAALRRHDPHHLCLGSRLHKHALVNSALLTAAGRHLDAVSINFYAAPAPTPELLACWRRASGGRPLVLTEFYAKGSDGDFDNRSGAGWIVRTQADRADFYENMVITLLESGDFVSWQWFRHRDGGGRGPNKGLLDPNHQPYQPFGRRMAEVNADVYSLADYFGGTTRR